MSRRPRQPFGLARPAGGRVAGAGSASGSALGSCMVRLSNPVEATPEQVEFARILVQQATLLLEVTRLAEAARAGKLAPNEMGGGTITVTSLGPLGGIATTPVINRPEVAIIGPNKIVERPVFKGDEVVRAKLMNLSISCDHRVVDGWDAASFVQGLKKYLETPVLLFAD